MIKEIRQIPITAESHPFGTAEKKCDFARRGFVEEEYFMYGTANVYKNVDGIAAVAYRDAPYVNRFVVRRPDTKERFSGNIVVEILNSTSWIDIDRMWAISREKFMRDGDIYVGITSGEATRATKPTVVKSTGAMRNTSTKAKAAGNAERPL